jgi:hypothetical protein
VLTASSLVVVTPCFLTLARTTSRFLIPLPLSGAMTFSGFFVSLEVVAWCISSGHFLLQVFS